MRTESNGIAFEIDLGGQGADCALLPLKGEPGVKLWQLRLCFQEERVPQTISLTFHVPRADIFSVFRPNGKSVSGVLPDWNPVRAASSSASGAPLLALVGKDDGNRLTVALSDCQTPCCLKAGYHEAGRDMTVCVEWFSSPVAPMKRYAAVLRLDMRRIPAARSIAEACCWWKENGYPTARLPDAATLPMYAPWYVFQQNFTDEVLLAECRRARELGMETVIVDDGWQTDDNGGGYAFCGDWQVCKNKIRDMRRFADALHGMGMKLVLWFSVPFMGKNAAGVERFRGKYLYFNESLNTYVLDPRFREVRDYLVSVYERFLEQYDLDGFKLDFIDAFRLTPQSPVNYDEMDFVSLEDAVDALIGEVSRALKGRNPEVLLEFRQHYTGAMMQKYGNMFRVGDCPGNGTALRVGVAELRMITKGVAVHSDPSIWSYDDPVESAAYQLNHSLFGVPQISLRLCAITEPHRRMLAHYLRYFRENREILLFGTMLAEGFEQSYTALSALGEEKSITVLYAKNILSLSDLGRDCSDVINATAGREVYLRADTETALRIRITDCMGDPVEETQEVLRPGLHCLTVPVSGFLHLEKIKHHTPVRCAD